MSQRGVLIGLLVLASVLVDCAVVMVAGPTATHPTVIVVWGLEFSQVNLMAIWLALGRTSGPLRLTGTVVVLALWSWALATLPNASEPKVWALLLTAQTIGVSVPLLIARLLGLGLVDESFASEAEDSVLGPKKLQFSIAYLLGWMTAMAFALGTMQYIAPDRDLPLELLLEWRVVVLLLGGAAVALGALCAALGTGGLATRMIVLCAVVVGTLVLLLTLFPHAEEPLVVILLEVLLLLGSLAVFRTAGYRVRVRRGE